VLRWLPPAWLAAPPPTLKPFGAAVLRHLPHAALRFAPVSSWRAGAAAPPHWPAAASPFRTAAETCAAFAGPHCGAAACAAPASRQARTCSREFRARSATLPGLRWIPTASLLGLSRVRRTGGLLRHGAPNRRWRRLAAPWRLVRRAGGLPRPGGRNHRCRFLLIRRGLDGQVLQVRARRVYC
jgi:hypothetical protein